VPELVPEPFVDGGALLATRLDPCDVEVDFADAGPATEVLLEVADVGSGVLDLSVPFDAQLEPAFRLRMPTLAPVQPGESYEFGIFFAPPDAGSFQGSLTIQTDGNNASCRSSAALTVTLRGRGE
jgi:hypothetical protein